MIKVMTIVGTRPELIKMSRVISEFDKYTNHILVHTGQNYDYELNQIFFEELGIKRPDYFLNAAGENAATTIGQVIIKSDEVLALENPDAVLLYGDTNSCLSVISAKRRKIPIFHMEAGNRCFDQRVPEELNRKVLDHLSDINLVLTEHARRYLINEGVKPESIIKTGSHMKEVIDYYLPFIKSSKILEELDLLKDKYFLVSMHREENVDSKDNLLLLLDTLNSIAEKYKLPIIISTHPRTRARLEQLKDTHPNPLIRFEKPFGFFGYNQLQINAKCVLSDSGTIAEESSLLKLKSVMIRNTHERPECMDAGTLIMSGLNKESVLDAISIIIGQHEQGDLIESFGEVRDYDESNVSKKILRIVCSYAGYVRRTVWHN